jgi:hypothetical protein
LGFHHWLSPPLAATAGGATAAAVVNLTVTNVVTGTLTYIFGANTGVGVPSVPLVVQYNPYRVFTGDDCAKIEENNCVKAEEANGAKTKENNCTKY